MKISVTETLEAIIFEDCTGTYSGDNKGGYGIPNLDLANMTDSYIEVQSPSSTEKYPFKIQTFPNYPAKDAFAYEILPYMIGQSNNEFESGEWKFRQTVVFTAKNGKVDTKTALVTQILTKAVECCIYKATQGKLTDGEIFTDPKKKLVIELSNLLQSALRNKNCGNTEEAKKTIDYLKAHCNCCGCL